jgi:hypothetical protein
MGTTRLKVDTAPLILAGRLGERGLNQLLCYLSLCTWWGHTFGICGVEPIMGTVSQHRQDYADKPDA